MCSDGVWLYGLLKFVSSVIRKLLNLFVGGCLKVNCSGKSRNLVVEIRIAAMIRCACRLSLEWV